MSGEPTIPGGLEGRLAILHPGGHTALGPNPFGKDVANLQLWQALARHGGYARVDILTTRPVDAATMARDLLGDASSGTEVVSAPIVISRAPIEAGVLLRGQPDLADLAWARRRGASDRAYSLIGLIHTLAPPAVSQIIAGCSTSPMFEWDALICTSPSVRDGLEAMFAGWGEHLAERTGGRPPPRPALPVIPLGVDAAAFGDRPQGRAKARRELGLAEGDILILWVGRLSYYEKAFPQPMFKAAQGARTAAGARVVFVMAGWFPGANDRGHYEQAAREQAPDVDVQFVDGNDRERLCDLWAGTDIFLSLVDNIQETFGITPLEAMASGLPVVVSDWDGYRATVRHGVEGFLIPTLGGPIGGGLGAAIVERHTIGGVSYQAYAGAVAQHTAVHIGRAAEALAQLIRSPDLRRQMGAAGRARVRETYDWPVVARQIHALTDDLARVRAGAGDPQARVAADPVKSDPFRTFAGFASQTLTLETRLTVAPGASVEAVRGAGRAVALDGAFPDFRAPPTLCAEALQVLLDTRGATVREVLLAFPVPQRRAVELGLAWMTKCGFVDWLT